MKISIITPSLNSEKYIEDNLRSVHLQQKNSTFSIEQIIVDGNSTDRTIEIIEAFKEKHNANIIIIQGKDKNMYDAINKGLKAMSGDVWACLNTDDYYPLGTFNLITKEFSKHPEVDAVYGYLNIIDENGKFIRKTYLLKFKLNPLILRKRCNNISQPSIFLRRNILEKVGYFDINYNYASDYDYLIRIGHECNLKLVPKSITNFRQHKQSISCNKKTQTIQMDESILISEKYVEKYSIRKENITIYNLKCYIIQIKVENMKYLFKRLYEYISLSR